MKFLLSIFVFLFGFGLQAQNLYDLNTIQEVHITFDFSDWDLRMDTAIAGSESYTIASQVEINGVVFDSVGVKYKGNSSYKATNKKNPLHIELNYVKGNQDYNGVTDLKLSNGFADPTFVRESVSYWLLSHYMHAPRANYAKVYINGVYYGLMTNVENIGKTFVEDHFYSSNGPFFKCTPVGGAGPGGANNLPNLAWLGSDTASYTQAYEIKSDYGFAELIDLIDTLNNNSAYIDQILDVDRALWMLAFNNLMVNLDSYTGAFAQNYYLYRGDNRRFSSVVWDLNMSFGAFSMLGGGGPGGALDSTAMKNMSPTIQSTNTARPLIKKLLENPTYKRMYLAHLRTMLQEKIMTGEYLDKALENQAIIDAAVQLDVNKFYTYAQFLSNLYWGVAGSGGGMGSPGIVSLMNGRTSYLNGTSEISAVPPGIANITHTNQPALGASVWVTAQISGTSTAVMLGWRNKTSDVFTRTAMFDDGQHQDGAAGDGVFGGSFTANSPISEYYIYAENTVAGAFFPARAEHEFLTVETALPFPNIGELAINELLADNLTGAADPNGELEDWIELYNNTNVDLNLTGLYLSDNVDQLAKWAFPNGTVLGAHSYLIVWADEDGSQPGLHANFKLKASDEGLWLSTAEGDILDSIHFINQVPDRTFGRYPNGTGNFTDMPPTFAAENSLTIATHQPEAAGFVVVISPNPATDRVTVSIAEPQRNARVQLVDARGQLIFETHEALFQEKALDTRNLPAGFYTVIIAGEKRFEGHFIKQ